MKRLVPLREIAHARAGDKGNRSNVSVWVYDEHHFEAVRAQLTVERVKESFSGVLKGAICRYELPALGGLNFVMDEALEGGVNESLNLDGHGKSWSFMLLGLEIEVEAEIN
jgi:hypothetical protein